MIANADAFKAESSSNLFDVIIIGSGIGGLTTASLLATIGKKRVLVLESHFKFGGFLHSFKREGFEWDPGCHYVGDMAEGSRYRTCMDLITGRRVQWHKMDSPFEKIMFPDEVFDVPACPQTYQRQLTKRFPHEAKNIRQYFRDVKTVQNWSRRWYFSKQLIEPLASLVSIGRKLVLKRTQDYMNVRFRDPLLKAVLTAQWGDYGTPPDKSAFGVHAIVAGDFQTGGYYPIGGSQKIADAAVKNIKWHGGRCLASHRVEEILIDDNRAFGVRVSNKGKTMDFFAPHIVSNAGVATTFNKLVPSKYGKSERSRIARVEPGPSAVTLYLGLNDDPRKHGFQDCNYWMFDSTDYETPDDALYGGAFMSIGSLRNPGQQSHTAQIVTFSDFSDWTRFAETKWMQRGSEYTWTKEMWTNSLINFVEDRLPGFRDLIAYKELSSPLTVESFTGHHQAQIYGRACTPSRLSTGEFSIGTSVKRLYLTGTDVTLPGINSGLMIGVMTAAKILGPWFGIPGVLTAQRRTAL